MFVILPGLACCPIPAWAAAKAGKSEALHGQPWAFGYSESRKDAIWNKGMEGKHVAGKKKSATPPASDAANTATGINRSLSEAERMKSVLGVDLGHEASSWKVAPEDKKLHPDENMYRQRQHVVRAFADVKAGEDLNISVGPELILKDEQHGEETANESQPDSALGVGMRFKFDF